MQQLDLQVIYRLLISKWKMLLIFAVIGAIVLGAAANFLMEEKYVTSVTMYVSSLTDAMQDTGDNISYNNLLTAEWLSLTYVDVLKNRSTIDRILPLLSRSVTAQELADMISLSSIANTAMMRIKVVADDPNFAAEVCNAMAELAPQVLNDVVSAGSIKVIGQASPGSKTSPNVPRMTMLGFLLGAAAAAGYVLLRHLTDKTVKTTAALKENLKVPVLGVVPHFEQSVRPRKKGDGKHA